ncbi:MAG TPA: hypothetical protein ENI23_06530 [bacterium]|nr:hypothetical protein [bacterium]
MKKQTLNIATRDDAEKVEGCLYAQEDGKVLFAHRLSTNDRYWNVSEPRTGLAVTFIGNSYKTMKGAMEGAMEYIKKSLKRTTMSWETMTGKPKQLNALIGDCSPVRPPACTCGKCFDCNDLPF